MIKKISLFLLMVSAFTSVFAQSAEEGNAFNKYMSPESGINPMSGTVAFSKNLASISAGNAQSAFVLNYSGNVFQTVKNRNDISSSGWVGLGWSMGFGKIVADNASSMTLLDDRYSLISASGVSYRIVKDEQNSLGKKWWIENLPYWSIEPKLESLNVGGKEYEIIVGWTIKDDKGIKYEYGDMSYCRSNTTGNDCSGNKATQYELSWPENYGHVGFTLGGNDYLYPNAWNVSKQIDLQGNSLTYFYEQEYKSYKYYLNPYYQKDTNKFTKECYLKSVESSLGSKIEFVVKSKGDAAEGFDGEILEEDSFDSKYLSQIVVKGNDDKTIGNIGLCYKAFNVKPTNDEAINKKYVKRLLTRIVWKDGLGNETDREEYFYNEKSENVESEPVGALVAIQGSNCGRIEYKYAEMSFSNKKEGTLHSEVVDATHVSMGYLDNGVPYLVGAKKNDNTVVIYIWKNGKWQLYQTLDDFKYEEDSHFEIGKNNWFAYISKKGESYDVRPIMWDGEKWNVGNVIKDSGINNVVALGPNYIVKVSVSNDERLSIEIPWTTWGKSYKHPNTYSAETGSWDLKYLKVLPTKNHIALTYLRATDTFNNNVLQIFTFDFSKDDFKLNQTEKRTNLDDDNSYVWGDGFLFGATEAQYGLWGSYGEARHWNGSGWTQLVKKRLNGVQGIPTIQASGKNYYAIRHNDEDDLSLFHLTDSGWVTPYKNENMVFDDGFDLFVSAEWSAVGSSDFFVAKRPWITDKISLPILCWPSFYRWGVKKKCIDIDVWSSTNDAALLELFEYRNGDWKRGGHFNPIKGDKRKKNVLAGNNWFVEEHSKRAFVWNGEVWNEESLSGVNSFNNAYVLGDFFAVENTEGKTTIYYKKHDSFVENPKSFVVVKKIIEDPIEATRVNYDYAYIINDNDNEVGFDYINNTPLINVVKVKLPENAGTNVRKLCNYKEEIGLALGQVCEESYVTNFIEENKTVRLYSRIRKKGWPAAIYNDVVSFVKSTEKGKESAVVTTYNNDNGLVQNIKRYYGKEIDKIESGNSEAKSSSETKFVYAVDNKDFFENYFKDDNRLTDVLLSYECKPNCSSGSVVAANAINYGFVSGFAKIAPKEKLVFNGNSQKTVGASALNTIENALKVGSPNVSSTYFRKNSEIKSFYKGKVHETLDAMNHPKAVIYDADKRMNPRVEVANGSVDEILVIPGDACEYSSMDIVSCKNIELSKGNAIDAVGKNPIDYGRFSNKVMEINNSSITGKIKKSKGVKYLFSAWIQKVDESKIKLNLVVGNNNVEIDVEGNSGKWNYVEWTGVIPQGNDITVSLGTSANVRVQDFRLIPAQSDVTISYYDEYWNKPSVIVDSRGIGTYFVFDTRGRIIKNYTEDNNGDLFLTKQNSYTDGSCNESTSEGTEITLLTINGAPVNVPEVGATQVITLAGNVNTIIAAWTLNNHESTLKYRVYKDENQKPSWVVSCCSDLEGLFIDISGFDSWYLDISTDDSEKESFFTINLKKSPVGWVNYGSILNTGKNPLFSSHDDASKLYYFEEDALSKYEYGMNSWNQKAKVTGTFSSLNSSGNNFVFALPEIAVEDENDPVKPKAYAVSSSALSDKGSFTADEVYDGMYKSVENSNNQTVVVYKNMEISKGNDGKEKQEAHLKSVVYENGSWKPLGALADFNGDYSKEPNLVEGFVDYSDALDFDVINGPDNDLYVAYIGTNSDVKKMLESSYGYSAANYSLPKVLVVKKLYSAKEANVSSENTLDVWAGPSLSWDENANEWFPNYLGDFLALTSSKDGSTDPVADVNRVKLAHDGSNLYVAAVYTKSSKHVLSVFKGSFKEETEEKDGSLVKENKLVFTTLDNMDNQFATEQDVDDEKNVIAYLETSSVFDFWVKDGIPYVMFTNAQNHNALTVVSYSGQRWISVGLPVFAYPRVGKNSASLSFVNQKEPAVALETSDDAPLYFPRKKVTSMKHVSEFNGIKEKDITLLSIIDVNKSTSISTDFRQYILNYESKIEASVAELIFKVVPKTLDDVLGIQVYNNDALVDSWKVNADKNLLNKFWNNVNAKTYDASANFDVPVYEGSNEISFVVTGVDGSTIKYNFVVERPNLPKDNSVTILASASTAMLARTSIKSTSNEKEVVKEEEKYVVNGIGDNGEICFSFGPGQYLVYDESVHYRNTCIDFDFGINKEQFVIIKDENGNEKKIIVEKSSDAPRSSSSNIANESDGFGFGDGSGVAFRSSSSKNTEESSNDDAEESLDDNPNGLVPNTAIPNTYKSFVDYNLYAEKSLTFADRVVGEMVNYVGENVEVGANAVIYGNLYSKNGMNLRNNSFVQNAFYVSEINKQDGARIENLSLNTKNVPILNATYFVSGYEDVVVPQNTIKQINPGCYKELHVFSNSTVYFAPGVYYFEKFIVEPDSKVSFDVQGGATQIWVSEKVNFGDRVDITSPSDSKNLFVYTNASSDLYLGVTSNLHATVVAPNANVIMAPKSTWAGNLWARSINVQPGVVLK